MSAFGDALRDLLEDQSAMLGFLRPKWERPYMIEWEVISYTSPPDSEPYWALARRPGFSGGAAHAYIRAFE